MPPLLLSNPLDFPPALRSGVLSIGNFDGVHAGHAKMLSTGRAEAARRNIPFTIMTFDPHPAAILRPGVKRIPLTTTEQRRELLCSFSPDVLIVIPTTAEFLAMSAEDFLRNIVQGAIGATLMVEGPSFTFGKGAKGTVERLKVEGPAYGIETLIVPTQQVTLSDLTSVKVSSTLTRWLVEHGRVKDAWQCLKRPYAMRGDVIAGQKRGRTIGFPTANVRIAQLLPAAGIYAGRAQLPDGRLLKAAISVGTNPTFDGKITTVEAYLLDFDEDLYGQTIEVEFHRWIREMLAFSGAGPLIERIKQDVKETQETVQLEDAR